MKIARKIYNIVVFIEVAIIVVMFALLGAPRFASVEPRIVLSGSMEPEILTGSVAYINKNVKSEDIEVGDIIAFNIGEESVVVHRVVAINETESCFVTKGDANEELDFNPISFSDYEGKVVGSIPMLGYLLEKIKGVKVIIVSVLVFVSHLIIEEIIEQEEENHDEQKTKESIIR